MRQGVRISEQGHLAKLIEIPEVVKISSKDDIPGMKVALDHLRQRGAEVEADRLSEMVIVSGTGVYRNDELILDEPVISKNAPFIKSEVPEIIFGTEHMDWILYGYEVAPYALSLFYYHAADTEQRGVIELGQNFSGLQMTFETKTQRSSVYIWRNRRETCSLFKRFRHPYMECSATVSTRDYVGSVESSVVRHEISGTDTLYIDDVR